MNNLSRETSKQILVSRSKKFGSNIVWIIWGIPIGWSLCHYFVNLYGGSYPNVSITRFIFDFTENIWELLSVLGIGSLPALVAFIWSLYKKSRKGDNDK